MPFRGSHSAGANFCTKEHGHEPAALYHPSYSLWHFSDFCRRAFRRLFRPTRVARLDVRRVFASEGPASAAFWQGNERRRRSGAAVRKWKWRDFQRQHGQQHHPSLRPLPRQHSRPERTARPAYSEYRGRDRARPSLQPGRHQRELVGETVARPTAGSAQPDAAEYLRHLV